jgi:hypothetical protein
MGIFERIKAKRRSENSAEIGPSIASETSPTNSTTEKSEEGANIIGPVDPLPLGDVKVSEPTEKEDGTVEEDQPAEVEDESKYPSGFPLAILTFGLCVSLFVVALDNTIIGKPTESPPIVEADHFSYGNP